MGESVAPRTRKLNMKNAAGASQHRQHFLLKILHTLVESEGKAFFEITAGIGSKREMCFGTLDPVNL